MDSQCPPIKLKDNEWSIDETENYTGLVPIREMEKSA